MVSVLSNISDVSRGQQLMLGHCTESPVGLNTPLETGCGNLAPSPGAPSAFHEMAGWSF